MPRHTAETVSATNDAKDNATAEQAAKSSKKRQRRKTYAYIDDDGNIVESSDDEKNGGSKQGREADQTISGKGPKSTTQPTTRTARKAPVDRSKAIQSRSRAKGNVQGAGATAAAQAPDGSNSWITIESRKKQRSSPTRKSQAPLSQHLQTTSSANVPSRMPSPVPSIALLPALPSPASRQNLRPDSMLRPGLNGPTYASVVSPGRASTAMTSSSGTTTVASHVARPEDAIIVVAAAIQHVPLERTATVVEPAAAAQQVPLERTATVKEPAATADDQPVPLETAAITAQQALPEPVPTQVSIAPSGVPEAVVANKSTVISNKRPPPRSDDDDSDAVTELSTRHDTRHKKKPRSGEEAAVEPSRNDGLQRQQPRISSEPFEEATPPRTRVPMLTALKRAALRDAANERSLAELSQREISATTAPRSVHHSMPAVNPANPELRASPTVAVSPHKTSTTATGSGRRPGMTAQQCAGGSHLASKPKHQVSAPAGHPSQVVQARASLGGGGGVSRHRASGKGDGAGDADDNDNGMGNTDGAGDGGADADTEVDVGGDGDGDVGVRPLKNNRNMECFQYPKDGDDLQALLFADSQNESKNGGRHGHCYPGQRLCLLRRDGEEQLVRFKNSVPKDFVSMTERLSPKVLSQRRYALWNALAKGGQKLSELSHSLTVVMHLDTARRKPELDLWANPWALYYMQDDIDTMARQMFAASNQITRNDPMHHTNVSVTSTLVRDAQLKYEHASQQLVQEQEEKRAMMAELELLRAQRHSPP